MEEFKFQQTSAVPELVAVCRSGTVTAGFWKRCETCVGLEENRTPRRNRSLISNDMDTVGLSVLVLTTVDGSIRDELIWIHQY